LGAGEYEYDRIRLAGVAATIEAYCDKTKVKLLDVGCCQGGLLAALEERGFGKQTGLDLSPVCAAVVEERGFPVINNYLENVPDKFEFISLSHVLEHIEDVRGFLRQVATHLTTNGRVYIEVPDASRYADFPLRLLDFNSEHINHFTMEFLTSVVLHCGFDIVACSGKIMPIANGSPFPAIWVVAERKAGTRAVQHYIENSLEFLRKASDHIEKELGDSEECILWGAGEYLAHILAMPVFQRIRIVQVVDRNPLLWGKTVAEKAVQPPSFVMAGSIPVVIAAFVGERSIRKDIEKMSLPNKVIGLEFT
jgi:SAM-dependent methyltransferase